MDALPGFESEDVAQDEPQDPGLVHALGEGLRIAEPLGLLAVLSGLTAALDPRTAGTFEALGVFGGSDERPDLSELVDFLIDTNMAETTAGLAVLQAIAPDDLPRVPMSRELARRRHRLPKWLTGLTEVNADPQVFRQSYVLGDEDAYLFGVRFPSGHRLSALVHVDADEEGVVVADALLASESVAELAEELGIQFDREDYALELVDAATVRAIVEDAAGRSLGQRQLDSDFWPMCCPLVEWLLRQLPPGGSVPPRPQWSVELTAQLMDDFFGSPEGAGLDDRERRKLLTDVVRFGTQYGSGDPLLWSLAAAETLLVEWGPRNILVPSSLALLPSLLGAFVRYAHQRRKIRPELTAATLAAVAAAAPVYQQLGRPDGPVNPAVFRQRVASALDELDELGVEIVLSDVEVEDLDAEVGGREALLALTDEPLPDESFSWDKVPDDIRGVVKQLLSACDDFAEQMLDIEHRTAMRRFLSQAAAAEPAIFRRKASQARGAAAVAWVICEANGTIDEWGSELQMADLLDWFQVRGGVVQRAEVLLRANGVDPAQAHEGVALGTPDLLVSACRADIIGARDRLLAE